MFDKPFKSLCGAISSWPYHHLNSRSVSLPPSLSSAFSNLAWAQLNFRNSISIVDIDVYVFTYASCIRSRQVSFVTVSFFFFRFSCGIPYQSIIDSQMRMMWHAEWAPVSKIMPFIVIEKERERHRWPIEQQQQHQEKCAETKHLRHGERIERRSHHCKFPFTFRNYSSQFFSSPLSLSPFVSNRSNIFSICT